MKDAKSGAGCLTLFALPFAGAGLIAAYLGASDLWEWSRMRAWEPVPARILEARLESSRSDGTVTYRVHARYEYEFAGARHQADRVTPSGLMDNVGSFHRDAYRELTRHRRSGEPFRAFVNPSDPGEAILFRELRMGLLGLKALVAFVFGGVGIGLMIAARVGARRLEREQALERAHPDEPWKWRDAWRDGRVAGGAKAKLVFAWLFAVFWNAVSAPVAFIVPAEVMDKGNTLALLGLAFPAVGVGLLVWAIRETLRWRKFGRSVFEMTTVPGALGGVLHGDVVLADSIEPQEGFRQTLSCIRITKERSGKRSNTRERVLWQTDRNVERADARRRQGEFRIPVHFDLPYDQPESDEKESDNRVVWRLEIGAEVPGVDLKNTFDVPVFKTTESRPAAPTPPPGRHDKPLDAVAALGAAGISVRGLPGGRVRIEFPRARHPSLALGFTIFTALWIGAVWLNVVLGFWIVFPILFGLIAIPLVLFSLDLWLSHSSIEASNDGVELMRGWFGNGKPRSFGRAEIREVSLRRGMQAGTRLYYDVYLKTAAGRSLIAAKAIEDQRLAEQVKAWIEGAPLEAASRS